MDTALPGPHPSPHCQLGLAPQPLCTQNMATPPHPRGGGHCLGLESPGPCRDPPHPQGGDCPGPVPPGPVAVWSHSTKHGDLCVPAPSLPPWTPELGIALCPDSGQNSSFCFSTSKVVCVGGPPPLSVGIHPLYTGGRLSLPTRVPGKPLLGCGDKAALLPGSPYLSPLAAAPAGPTAPVLRGGRTVPSCHCSGPFTRSSFSHTGSRETPATVTRAGPCVDPRRLPRGKGRAGSS